MFTQGHGPCGMDGVIIGDNFFWGSAGVKNHHPFLWDPTWDDHGWKILLVDLGLVEIG